MHTRGSSALVFLTLRASVNIAFASRSFAEFMRTRAGVKRFCQPGEQGAADISLAGLCSDSSAGKMQAALYGSWRAPFRFSECIGTMNRANR